MRGKPRPTRLPAHIAEGYWYQFVFCVSKSLVDRHEAGLVSRKHGGSHQQIRVQTSPLEVCGFCYHVSRIKDMIEDAAHIKSVASYLCHGHRQFAEEMGKPQCHGTHQDGIPKAIRRVRVSILVSRITRSPPVALR